MNAIILAAGFGTRLHPVTEKIPKALVPVVNVPLLEIQLRRLELFGFTHVALNTHHLSDQILDFVHTFHNNTLMTINCSIESKILNTGGGIKKMLSFFPHDQPILVLNVDILSSLDYKELLNYHTHSNAKATLVVNNKKTDRPLAFSKENRFLGRVGEIDEHKLFQSVNFCGIQVIQPQLFATIENEKFYSIDVFIKSAQRGDKIISYDISDRYWRDLGTVHDLEMAKQDIEAGLFKI